MQISPLSPRQEITQKIRHLLSQTLSSDQPNFTAALSQLKEHISVYSDLLLSSPKVEDNARGELISLILQLNSLSQNSQSSISGRGYHQYSKLRSKINFKREELQLTLSSLTSHTMVGHHTLASLPSVALTSRDLNVTSTTTSIDDYIQGIQDALKQSAEQQLAQIAQGLAETTISLSIFRPFSLSRFHHHDRRHMLANKLLDDHTQETLRSLPHPLPHINISSSASTSFETLLKAIQQNRPTSLWFTWPLTCITPMSSSLSTTSPLSQGELHTLLAAAAPDLQVLKIFSNAASGELRQGIPNQLQALLLSLPHLTHLCDFTLQCASRSQSDAMTLDAVSKLLSIVTDNLKMPALKFVDIALPNSCILTDSHQQQLSAASNLRTLKMTAVRIDSYRRHRSFQTTYHGREHT